MEQRQREYVLHEVDSSSPEPKRQPSPPEAKIRPVQRLRFRSKDDVFEIEARDQGAHEKRDPGDSTPQHIRTTGVAPTKIVKHYDSPLPQVNKYMMYRFGTFAFLLVVLLHSIQLFQKGSLPITGVEGGAIPVNTGVVIEDELVRRDNSPTSWCVMWAQQSALVNGTLYLYGGEQSIQQGQTDNTWNNNFLTLDLTRTWQISSPSFTGLPVPSGPPAVALGTLWNSHDSLYLYGGEFSWKPAVSPTPFALWEYDILSSQWIEHNNPETSNGVNAPDNNVSVQRAAEGAGVSIPFLGRGFYFGGHLDGYTTAGWSQSIYRVYLESLLEFTMPGFKNTEVQALSNNGVAETDGNYRNITQGGLQSAAGFTKRADGLLIYVPGFGTEGILLALAGGTNVTYTQMNNIDVYDIATSTWYKQSTGGSYPQIRVNPCAVAAAAPDGSSYNIYMFGGQALQPAGSQQQYDDMWILTLPSFTWIQVDQSKQSVPYGRSGATCSIWDGQMIMVGGYVGTELGCDSPGVYVFDLSNLQWVNQFTALSPGASSTASARASSPPGTSSATGAASSSSTFNSTGSDNPFNQQPAQLANGQDPGGLEGSYGYLVPEVVISIVGGDSTGGATVTAPVETATAGPLATGKPITYTVTQPNGATVTETGVPGGTVNGNSSDSSTGSGHSGTNIGAIVAGVIAGLLFIAVCYLTFCAFIYRKRLKLYQRHVSMSQRQARGEKLPAIPGVFASDSTRTSSDPRGQSGVHTTTEVVSHSSFSGNKGGNGINQPINNEIDRDSTDDLISGTEPTFVGVLLNPRRSLRVVNRD